uniref:Secreted protein n=1 Tax=Panagrellus redivivus TaxID=6233 RepID=A0A7E4ZUA2_PANRE
MNINILVFAVVAISPALCDNRIGCHVYNDTNWRSKGDYCVYALKEDGTHQRNVNGGLKWKLNFNEEDTPMNKCIKPPGLAAFKRCNIGWCNRHDCTGVEIVPWPEALPETTTLSTEVISTTLSTTSSTLTSTAAITTLETATTEALITTNTPLLPTTLKSPHLAVLLTLPNGTSEESIGPNCETGRQYDQNELSGLPLTNVFDNEQVNVVYNIPPTSSRCECRCNQNKKQNIFIVA